MKIPTAQSLLSVLILYFKSTSKMTYGFRCGLNVINKALNSKTCLFEKEVRFDFDTKDVSLKESGSTSLRDFREHAGRGIQLFKTGNLIEAINSFEFASVANSSQPLAQLGICYYCNKQFDKAATQLAKDVKKIEASKQFKASDLRLWLSASLNQLSKNDDAYYALDLNNVNVPGIIEERLLMNYTLNFYGQKFAIEDMLEFIGLADERDFEGRRFYGNFYLGLYFDSMKNADLSEAFLQFPSTSRKYHHNDMW